MTTQSPTPPPQPSFGLPSCGIGVSLLVSFYAPPHFPLDKRAVKLSTVGTPIPNIPQFRVTNACWSIQDHDGAWWLVLDAIPDAPLLPPTGVTLQCGQWHDEPPILAAIIDVGNMKAIRATLSKPHILGPVGDSRLMPGRVPAGIQVDHDGRVSLWVAL